MTFDWIAVVRDVLVIGYMFMLRIGVPLLVTMLGGMWLRKVLEPKPSELPRPATPPVQPPVPQAPRL